MQAIGDSGRFPVTRQLARGFLTRRPIPTSIYSFDSCSRSVLYMFESLSDKLKKTLKNLRGQGKLTPEHVDAALARDPDGAA